MDPRTKLVLLAVVGILAVALERPASLGLLLTLCAVALVAGRGVDRRWLVRGALLVLAAVWGTVLSQGLFYADHPRVSLASLGPLHLYREGVLHGLVQSLRMVAVALAGLAVVTTTAPDRLFAGLQRLRVPWGVAFLAVTALRFVPVTAREMVEVRRARARRGRPIHRRAPWAWLALEVALLRPVVARALRRGRVLAESLDARGFDPGAPRATRRPLRFRPWEIPLLSASICLALGIVSARVLFLLYVGEVVWWPQLRTVYAFVRGWL